MRLSTWPFRPDHITNDGHEYPPDSPLNKLTGGGIISNTHMQGMQTSICATLQNPTTIIEFAADGSPVRTDSQLLFFTLHPPCLKFRVCTEHRWCYCCDNAHALLFRGLDKENVVSEGRIRAGSNAEIAQYRQDPELLFQFAETELRSFLQYDCPLLGYRELLFPIFFEDRVIAVFFVGELCPQDKVDFIKRKQRDFFKQHPGCFANYCQANPGVKPGDIVKEISGLHRKWVSDPSHVLDDRAYQKIIETTCYELAEFENMLADQVELQREYYVRTRLDRRIEQFHEKLPRDLSPGEDSLAGLWSHVESSLEELVTDFCVRYSVLFSINRLTTQRTEQLDVVARAGELPEHIAARADSLRFDLTKVPPEALARYSTSAEYPSLLKGLTQLDGLVNPETNRVRLIPVPFLRNGSIAVLIGYYPNNPPHAPENRPGGYLDTSLRSFYSIVVSSLSSLIAAAAQISMEAALRIFGHEAGQQTAGLDWLRSVYLSDVDALRSLSGEKAQDIERDFDAYVKQLLFMTKNARMLIEVPEPKNKPFLAYGELVFKWKDIYRLEAEGKCLQFHVDYPRHSDLDRPAIYGDQILLEQLLYNLVNNAVKYSFRGTKIRIDCKKRDRTPSSPHVLTVTNYGIELEDDPRIYDLYHHGRLVIGEEGLGIGLYIAKQIALAHGGTTEHFCTKLSRFNVPLIEPYLKTDFPGKEETVIMPLSEELDRLKESGQYHNIVALDEYEGLRYSKPTRLDLINSIRKRTWKVSFTVTIPAKEGRQ